MIIGVDTEIFNMFRTCSVLIFFFKENILVQLRLIREIVVAFPFYSIVSPAIKMYRWYKLLQVFYLLCALRI